jgi:AcrR family transcriptional regulator
MPRHVDHDARRDLVAQVAADLVAEHGLEALTVRRVAEAAGHSTTVVSHYFADRRDLVRATYRAAGARSSARFDAALVGADDPLQACLEALLPIDEARARDVRTWLAFWAMAVADRELAQEQDDRVQSARRRIADVLAGEQQRGRVRTGLDLAEVAYELLVLVHGVGTHAVFDRTHWTPERQRRAVAAELDALRVPSPEARRSTA